MEIKIERAKTLKEKPNQDNLGFGPPEELRRLTSC